MNINEKCIASVAGYADPPPTWLRDDDTRRYERGYAHAERGERYEPIK